jgi:nucleoid-associated protein YgaU
MGGIGRIGGAFLALLLAAAALFFLGPMLLGIGSPDDGAGAGAGAATATPPGEETAPPEPTVPPAPTPKVYVVAKGDTISRIAKKHDLTIEQLLAANKQIKNPNKIKIGDEITIPVPEVDDEGLDGGGESAEP